MNKNKKKMFAFVGAGGKTTIMYRLADKFARAGKDVIVSTSTHIMKDAYFTEIRQASDILSIDREKKTSWPFLTLGRDAGEKISGLAEEEIDKLLFYADIVLIEADGAKHFPMKIPQQGEPVIPKACTQVLVCAGLDCLGQRLENCCFRHFLAKELFSWDKDRIVSEEDLARLLCDKRAGLKNIGKREIIFILNKADTDRELETAQKVKTYIKKFCKENQIVNRYKILLTSDRYVGKKIKRFGGYNV